MTVFSLFYRKLYYLLAWESDPGSTHMGTWVSVFFGLFKNNETPAEAWTFWRKRAPKKCTWAALKKIFWGIYQCWAVIRMGNRYLRVINPIIYPFTCQFSIFLGKPVLIYNHNSQKIWKSQRTNGYSLVLSWKPPVL
jgi:hypothetical protein